MSEQDRGAVAPEPSGEPAEWVATEASEDWLRRWHREKVAQGAAEPVPGVDVPAADGHDEQGG